MKKAVLSAAVMVTWSMLHGTFACGFNHEAIYAGQQLDLLVYARKCSFDLIDFSLAEVAVPALDAIGKSRWGRVFANIYVVDNEEFVHVARE